MSKADMKISNLTKESLEALEVMLGVHKHYGTGYDTEHNRCWFQRDYETKNPCEKSPTHLLIGNHKNYTLACDQHKKVYIEEKGWPEQ